MELLNNMDWDLLRTQKQWLIVHAYEHQSVIAAGLTNLLDEIQDQAVKNGVDPLVVFGE